MSKIKELFEIVRDVGDFVFTHVPISTQSMTVRGGFVAGFGLGACVGVGACVVFTPLTVDDILKAANGSSTTCAEASLSNRKERVFEIDIGNPTCVKDLEKIYFNGLDDKADLNETQIQQLKEFLELKQIRELKDNMEGDVEKNVEKLKACTTLAEILHLLSDLKLVQPKSYRKILTILKNSKIDLNVEHLAFNVERLENAVIDIEEKRTFRDYEHDQFELDVLILHSECDNKDVVAFKKHLIADGGIQRLSVQAIEEFAIGKGKLRLLGDIFTRTRYIFVFMTKNLQAENLSRLLTETALVDSIDDVKKNFRIVPVWTTKEKLEVPEMNVLQGLKYWNFTRNNEDSLYLTILNKTLVKGRATFVRAN